MLLRVLTTSLSHEPGLFVLFSRKATSGLRSADLGCCAKEEITKLADTDTDTDTVHVRHYPDFILSSFLMGLIRFDTIRIMR